MRKTTKSFSEKIVQEIKRATRKEYSSEKKIRLVLNGLRCEASIAELCREGEGFGLLRFSLLQPEVARRWWPCP